MTIEVFHINAFARQPFEGNPACVCLLRQAATDAWMQSVAAEMNLSETAFVWQRGNRFNLRWFTPLAEVHLCGHATMAAAHALWSAEWLSVEQPAVFDTLSGQLLAFLVNGQIEMDFPVHQPHPTSPPEGLFAALGIADAEYVGTDGSDYLLQLKSETCVRRLAPDFRRLGRIPTRGIIVTARSDSSQPDVVSRFFCPALGIDEDPVTGSAHSVLAPFWSARIGRNTLTARQVSRRGGNLVMRIAGERVFISGHCVSVFRGEMLI